MALLRIIIIILICSVSFAKPLKFGIASIVPEGTPDYVLTDLNNYISDKLGRSIDPVLEQDYDSMNGMVQKSDVDFASVCTTAISSADKIRIIAIPEIDGRHFYYTYIIVNKKYGIKDIKGLKGKTFAFTDKLTGSGSLYPAYLMINTFGTSPENVLKKIYYTQSNEQSIFLVNKGVVEAAAVDGAIFKELTKADKKLADNITVIHKSPVIINPPFVASSRLDDYTYNRLKSILLNMHKDIEGQKLLTLLNIDRFVPARLKDYENLMRIKNTVDKFRNTPQ